jgi:hypothetical protein
MAQLNEQMAVVNSLTKETSLHHVLFHLQIQNEAESQIDRSVVAVRVKLC